MTRYVTVPSRCLHRVADNLPWKYAALTEPCCVAFNAVVINAQLKPGDRIVVLGPGPIGLLWRRNGKTLRGGSCRCWITT